MLTATKQTLTKESSGHKHNALFRGGERTILSAAIMARLALWRAYLREPCYSPSNQH